MRSRALLNVLFLASTFVAATFSSIAIAQPPGGGGRGMMGGMGGMGGIAGLLRIPEVVEHLKLDETQKNELKEAQQSVGDEMRKLFEGMRPAGGGGGDAGGGRQGGGRGGFGGGMTDEMRKKMEEFNKKTEDKISEILDPTQFDRLVGLFSQQSPMQAIRHRLVVEKMKAANCPVTEEQESKMKEAEEAAGAKVREMMSGGFNPENMTKMGEIRKESEEKALGVLNDSQKKTFEEIKGEKFEFPRPQFGGPGGGRGGDRGGDRRPN